MGTTVDKLNKLLETKEDIKAAIVEKGQTVSDSDTFASYGDKIRAIESSSEPVLQAKTVTPTGEEIVVTADNDTYLYNGVELPDINAVWADKTSRQYAYIGYNNPYSKDAVYLYLTDSKQNVEMVDTDGRFRVNGPYVHRLTNEGWSYDTTGVVIYVFWSNVDVFSEAGSLYLAASDPIGYTVLSSVTIEGDPNLIPENIAKDITIYGVTGTHEGGSNGLALPEEYQTYLDEADAFYLGDYEHFFIAENEEFVTVGFLNADFTVTAYDPAAGDFASYGWYSYKYTKSTDNWEGTDYTSSESPGYNYAKNIKYADCYIKYNDVTLFPVGMDTYPDTTHIDYSNFDNGTFTETLETGDTLEYTVEFNESSQPNKITAPDGTVTWIEWGES